MFVWFFGLILTGTLLLTLPMCGGQSTPAITFLDALFTSTSASCVTGLSVRSTPHDFSFIGQLVILGLIQFGGVGIITVTTFVMLHAGGQENLRQKSVIAQTLGGADYDIRWVLRNVLAFVLLIEAIGFCLLFVRGLWVGDAMPALAAWRALFHAVSAFCNAGFALHDDNLIGMQGDPIVNLTIMSLIVIGGIGFPVMLDIRRHWRLTWSQLWEAISLHTKIMLIGTIAMLSLGTFLILGLEWNDGLKGLPIGNKIFVAMFQSTTTRTAGFNTIDLAKFSDETQFLMVLFMLIGAGPCSAAGGFKVSTLAVLLAHSWARLTGASRVRLFRRSIPDDAVGRAMSTLLLFGVVMIVAVVWLLMFDPASENRFLPAVFECASALGTVGLTINFTVLMNSPGRIIIILLMFLGRLGPITAFLVFARGRRQERIEYPKEEVLIG